MKLQASCHCQAVSFRCESAEPVPFLKCYCAICRKLNGSGGYGINIGADFLSLKLTSGEQAIDVYRPVTKENFSSPGIGKVSGRHFCRYCSSGLWNWDERWPDLFHPYPSIIDTDLPQTVVHTHMMLNYRPGWVQTHQSSDDKYFDEYPDESLRQWHERMGIDSG